MRSAVDICRFSPAISCRTMLMPCCMAPDHRVANRNRHRSWRSVSLSSSICLWTPSHIYAIKRLAVLPCGMPSGDVMEPRSDPTDTLWPFPFTPQDWAQTPLAVQAYVRALRDEVKQLHASVETLQARLRQNST